MASEMSRLKQPGFTKRPNRNAIEAFVEGYLKMVTSGNRLREERKFIEKAIMLINQVFGQPCCSVQSGAVLGISGAITVNLITPYDNQLTNTIRETIINGHIIRRTFRHTLERILNLLNNYLYGCCTTNVLVNYDKDTVSSTDVVVSAIDIVTGNVIFATTTIGGNEQTFSIPSKYFGPAALVKICINNITLPAPGQSTNLGVDGTLPPTILVSSSTLGQTCSNIVMPLQTTYGYQRS